MPFRYRKKGTLDFKAAHVGEWGMKCYLQGVNKRGNDLTPVWDKIRSIIFASEEMLFRQGGRTSDHQPWVPLRGEYAAWKEETHPGQNILSLHGVMGAQLAGKLGDHFETRARRRLVIGTHLPIESSSGTYHGWARDDFGGYDVGYAHAVGRHGQGAPWELPPPAKREPMRVSSKVAIHIADRVMDYVLDAPPVGGIPPLQSI